MGPLLKNQKIIALNKDLFVHEGLHQEILMQRPDGSTFIAQMGTKHLELGGSQKTLIMFQDMTIQFKLRHQYKRLQSYQFNPNITIIKHAYYCYWWRCRRGKRCCPCPTPRRNRRDYRSATGSRRLLRFLRHGTCSVSPTLSGTLDCEQDTNKCFSFSLTSSVVKSKSLVLPAVKIWGSPNSISNGAIRE